MRGSHRSSDDALDESVVRESVDASSPSVESAGAVVAWSTSRISGEDVAEAALAGAARRRNATAPTVSRAEVRYAIERARRERVMGG